MRSEIGCVVLAVCAIGCRKRAPEFRDAHVPPPPGELRGTFALTYYWVSADNPGIGVKDDPLVPYVSVAIDPTVIAIGSRLYVRELDGTTLPGGGTSDGCVVAADVGGRIKGNKLDWFVGQRASYQELDARIQLTHVTVHAGGERCP